MSVSVCLPASISLQPHVIFTKFFAHVAYVHGLVLLQHGDAIPRGRANFGVFFPIENALYGPYSGMNFATKDQFGFSLLLYPKVGKKLISYY